MAKSRTAGKITGDDYVRLKLSVEGLIKEGYTEADVLSVILPKSVQFRNKWLVAMRTILKENET